MIIIDEIRNIKSDKKELRKFGITFGTALCLLGNLAYWRGKDYYNYFLIISVVFLFSGITAPVLLKPIQKVLMSLAILIGWVLTQIILGVLFYLVVTPTGLLARLFGKDFINRKFDKNAQSYWIPKKEVPFDQKNYENQY